MCCLQQVIVLGGVKVDGTTVTINNGVISSAGGGGGGGGGGTSLGSRQAFNNSTSTGQVAMHQKTLPSLHTKDMHFTRLKYQNLHG